MALLEGNEMNKKSVMTIIVGAILFSVFGVIVSFRRFAPPLFYTSADSLQTTRIEHFILVISDGMSWERLIDLDSPNITRMISTGAAATHGISEVPSVTITNITTIPSGAHASTHGVVENVYLKRNAVSVDTIQEAVERDGLTFEELTSATAIVNGINSGTLANYTLWWSGDVDSAGHHYGPNSSQYVYAIYSMDTGIDQIMTALETTDLDEVTILGLGSDHGMQDLLPKGESAPDTVHILDLRAILEDAEFIVDKWRSSGPRMGHVFLADPP